MRNGPQLCLSSYLNFVVFFICLRRTLASSVYRVSKPASYNRPTTLECWQTQSITQNSSYGHSRNTCNETEYNSVFESAVANKWGEDSSR
ncbi:uncharacterized protein LY79DRAFT_571353 [Colletotrichum navitas]|uniref:Secreted protein n=1 Tax=Colletotrichum navitas TaxID=681940 RepID=A0AAD8PLV8_9PEZI|nr:uncharacterized protein LY79DRAFT_571353 [Colletotrichum navitas]KAK1569755.1 hypothetical protein LY79DRAFT_571353 [Colletotrichum navitas]